MREGGKPVAYQRLSAQDASFLHLETPTSPMHVGSVTLFEAGPFLDEGGRFRLDDVRRLIERSLSAVPRFRQRLMAAPLGSGRPVWVDDDRFDLAYHVRLTAVPRPGTEDQLRALAARLQASALDRRRPLWEFWFVEGVVGERVALIHKTHHAMVDGVSSVDVATVLFDHEPVPLPEAFDDPVPWEPTPAPSGAQLLAETLVERAAEPTEVVRSLLRGPGSAIDGALGIGRAIRAVTTESPRMPFNAPVGPHRRYEVARVDLEAVKVVHHAHACTVNDVVLAMVTGGLRHYLEQADVSVADLVLRALVPVSVRDDIDREQSVNRVAAFVADLPVGEPDPARRVQSIAAQLRSLKPSGGALGVDRINALLGYAPPTLLSLAARLVPLQRAVNLVVTNVPGPPGPLYCMGARMLEAFPYLGLVDNLGLAVAVVSYDGQLNIGLTGDRDLVPDLGVLAEGIEKSGTELVATARMET